MDLDEVWCTRNLDPASPARQTWHDSRRRRSGKHPEPKYDADDISTMIENGEQLEVLLRKKEGLPWRQSQVQRLFFFGLVFQVIRDSMCIVNIRDEVKTMVPACAKQCSRYGHAHLTLSISFDPGFFFLHALCPASCLTFLFYPCAAQVLIVSFSLYALP
jgi:hypothetical protein